MKVRINTQKGKNRDKTLLWKMKKLKYIMLPALLLGLAACNPNTSSSISPSSPSSNTSTSTTPPVSSSSSPVITETAAQRYQKYVDAPKDGATEVSIRAVFTGYASYSGGANINAYFQEDIYGYYAINFPKDTFTIGHSYAITAVKAKKEYNGLNGIVNKLNIVKSTELTGTEAVQAPVINLESADYAKSANAIVKVKDAMVTAVNVDKDKGPVEATIKIGETDYTISYNTGTVTGADIKAKFDTITVGSKITAQGQLFKDKYLSILEAADLTVTAAAVTYTGTIKGDPNSDLGGHHTGSIDKDHPITAKVTNNVITFGGGTEQIAWYDEWKGEDGKVIRAAGNRVGVQIDKPADLPANADPLVTIGNATTPLHFNEISDDTTVAKKFFWYYPLVTKANMGGGYDVKIAWTNDSPVQTFHIAIVSGTTLQVNPNGSTDPVGDYITYALGTDGYYDSGYNTSISTDTFLTELKKVSENIVDGITNTGSVSYSSTVGCLKIGSGKADATLTFTTTANVTKVTVKAVGWSSGENKMTINGVEKTLTNATNVSTENKTCSGSAEYEFELGETSTSIAISGRRFFIYSITFHY